jgi:glutamyl-tRNA synthetase
MNRQQHNRYRGRIAPSPTGYLHLGHARTFWTAQVRARSLGGVLVLRNEDLDRARCKPEFVSAMMDDLRWFGFEWQEGPDVGGTFAPYNQSERTRLYREALLKLEQAGLIYPCTCSRKDLQYAAHAPHVEEDSEPIYPGTCREMRISQVTDRKFNWRFRVPDGETITFTDVKFGPQQFVAGRDFGDFIIWRNDDVPAYQLACVVDDIAMKITEVVRGADLLLSTARQILLYHALGATPPDFSHCDLLRDEFGTRLSKRHDALSLRTLRQNGATPEHLQRNWEPRNCETSHFLPPSNQNRTGMPP